mmetsp:Transcript_16751/g.37784  ORF Transcript_16751/g.37784 Transcript_16751/m.37784 type:complete len:207 (+) Transcript_16751:53-673(+)|eukprot:CAMPEP_0197929884 /NCGR_PEP_ID=MMETSP1439-20131203/104533_1 /TAXON_ID=66791 /ORGANISM="Gonyaulax spinifera, Strain CCMP409" /LENGTH=206 /DNA_ID=CAMNT_0043552549 /DNA_START=53 /DNA_END=673 /DNA_ORIENTATION=-
MAMIRGQVAQPCDGYGHPLEVPTSLLKLLVSTSNLWDTTDMRWHDTCVSTPTKTHPQQFQEAPAQLHEASAVNLGNTMDLHFQDLACADAPTAWACGDELAPPRRTYRLPEGARAGRPRTLKKGPAPSAPSCSSGSDSEVPSCASSASTKSTGSVKSTGSSRRRVSFGSVTTVQTIKGCVTECIKPVDVQLGSPFDVPFSMQVAGH